MSEPEFGPVPYDPETLLPEHERPALEESLEKRYGFLPEFTVLAVAPVLWSGWEADYGAVLVHVRHADEQIIHLVAEVAHPAHAQPDPGAMLRTKITEYRDAITKTEALLKLWETGR